MGSTMHFSQGSASTSQTDVLLYKHVMPLTIHKWIVKAQPQQLVPEAHWTSWLPMFAFHRDKWEWGTLRLPRYGAPWETTPQPCTRCHGRHGVVVQECVLMCPTEGCF